MPPSRDQTLQRYRDAISDLLQEVTSKDTLELMVTSPAMKASFQERIKKLKINLASFEKRNSVDVSTEKINLDSVVRIINTVKVFNPDSKTFEGQRLRKSHKMAAKQLVLYFYQQLSKDLGQYVYVTNWPAETHAAKDVIKQLGDKDPEFIKEYIDWCIKKHNGVKKLHSIRFYVSQYLQTRVDNEYWEPLWARYSQHSASYVPTQEEELLCFFITLYMRHFGSNYSPQKTYKRDATGMSQLKTYLGDNLQKTNEYLKWVFEFVLVPQKLKPASPGDLFRFINDFKDRRPVKQEEDKLVRTTSIVLSRASKRHPKFNMDAAETNYVRDTFTQRKLEDFDTATQKLILDHPNIFQVEDSSISLKENSCTLPSNDIKA